MHALSTLVFGNGSARVVARRAPGELYFSSASRREWVRLVMGPGGRPVRGQPACTASLRPASLYVPLFRLPDDAAAFAEWAHADEDDPYWL